MIHLSYWSSPELLRPLSLALLHFVWQGTALAALVALLMSLTKNARARYAIGIVGLAAMISAPVSTFLILQDRGVASDRPLITDAPQALHATSAAFDYTHQHPASPEAVFEKSYAWLVQAWFLGVLLFSLRTAGGVVVLERLRRREGIDLRPALLERCLALQKRMGVTRFIRYCESIHLDAPAVVGWLRPVILIPVTALTGLSESQLQMVIAHELAHIRRFDAFANLFQIASESVLFYHPAVWWLSRRVREERENCCDDAALAVCGSPVEYVRALTLMEQWRATPAFAMGANHGSLTSRVRRLLGIPANATRTRAAGVAAGLLCLSVAVAAGNALFGVTRTTAAPQSLPTAEQEQRQKDLKSAIVIRAARVTPDERPTPAPEPAAAPQSGKSNPTPKPEPTPRPEPSTHESYIDGLKAAGLDNLSVDDIIALKVQGVTPDYIRQMQAAGLKPDVHELIAMRIQGVTPDYLRQMKGLGLNTEGGELIGLKVQGITPDYIREMRSQGIDGNTGEFIGMKVQGITPDYVREMKGLGLTTDAGELIGMKVQGITPDYVREMRAAGINPNSGQFIAMKVQGVTREYVKMLQDAGFKPDVDDCLSAKVQGLTREYIAKAQAHGFKNLDIRKLIELKHLGVLE